MDAAKHDQPHYVYMLRDAAHDVIYVGFTNDLARRYEHHKSQRPMLWARVVDAGVRWFPDRRSARLAEVETIRRFKPWYNFDKNPLLKKTR